METKGNKDTATTTIPMTVTIFMKRQKPVFKLVKLSPSKYFI